MDLKLFREPGFAAAAVPHAVGLSGGGVKPIPNEIRLRIATPLAHAFTSAFWWAVVLTGVAVIPAVVLAVTVRGGAARATAAGAPQAA